MFVSGRTARALPATTARVAGAKPDHQMLPQGRRTRSDHHVRRSSSELSIGQVRLNKPALPGTLLPLSAPSPVDWAAQEP